MNQNNAYLVNSFATAGKTLVLGIDQKACFCKLQLFRFFSLQIINASQPFWFIAQTIEDNLKKIVSCLSDVVFFISYCYKKSTL